MSKTVVRLALVLLLGLILGCEADTADDSPKTDTATSIEEDVAQKEPADSFDKESRFEQAVKSAFENQSVSRLDQLTCWDRVPEARRKATMKIYTRDVAFGAKEVKLTSPDPTTPDMPWDLDGITYKSNLEVTKNIKIEFGDGAAFKDGTYFVGEKDGKLFLLAPAPVEK